MAFTMSKLSSRTSIASKRSVAAKANTTKGTTSGKGGAAAINNIDYLKTLPGVSQPFPDVFDPANLSATASVKDLRRWRESEIVHGRVSMLAALGFIVGENVEDSQVLMNIDGDITGPAINHFQQVRQGFWEPLLIAIGLAESYRVSVGWATPVGGEQFNALIDDYAPGDLGFDPLGLKPTDPEALKEMQTKEINNGRLAMIGIAGFVAQELVSNEEIFEHLFLNIEKEAILEIDDIDKDLGLPQITPPTVPPKGVPARL